jgi:hypothetical protein
LTKNAIARRGQNQLPLAVAIASRKRYEWDLKGFKEFIKRIARGEYAENA